MIHDETFPEFERRLDAAFRKAGIRYTMHWSKNSGIDPDKLDYMYGASRIASWKAARRAVFGDDATLMKTFETDAMVRCGAGLRSATRAALIRRRSACRAGRYVVQGRSGSRGARSPPGSAITFVQSPYGSTHAFEANQ